MKRFLIMVLAVLAGNLATTALWHFVLDDVFPMEDDR